MENINKSIAFSCKLRYHIICVCITLLWKNNVMYLLYNFNMLKYRRVLIILEKGEGK